MGMQLEQVVPFGRSMDEYQDMFALSDDDRDKTILGVGDGPSSFNTEMSALGKAVVSVDPLYIYRGDEISTQFFGILDAVIAQVTATPRDWVWSYHGSPEQLRKHRIDVMSRFVDDYDAGKTANRYVVGQLPSLNFENGQFELALCSHFLFLYSEHLSYQFHLASVLEMLRVAQEVRIFPLLTLASDTAPYVQPLIDELSSRGYAVNVESVKYELQRGGNQMLRIQQTSSSTAKKGRHGHTKT